MTPAEHVCPVCERPVVRGKDTYDLSRNICRKCAKARAHESYLRARSSPEGRRRLKSLALFQKYGIHLADLEAMHERQGGRCAICRKVPGEHTRGLRVDHCHDTGEVRGLLCQGCNVSLALMEGPFYQAAIAYLAGRQ